ncbi:MAG TPA: SIS domain-containing protein [Acidimicrobiales bacterium]|nr:SIS domain-containing protein [Acidimicrobiales bacterium]
MSAVTRHLEGTVRAMEGLAEHVEAIERWGRTIGSVLGGGGRLLAAGNGGSAAEAQHLTAELVGRYTSERRPLSAIALHAETSALTAIANDYGLEAAYARQVEAHGRGGDILIALSTSGRSANVLQAVRRARTIGMSTLALTGPRPNPLAGACDDCIAIEAPSTASVQEAHLVAVHLLCEAVDETVAELDAAGFQSLGAPS